MGRSYSMNINWDCSDSAGAATLPSLATSPLNWAESLLSPTHGGLCGQFGNGDQRSVLPKVTKPEPGDKLVSLFSREAVTLRVSNKACL